MVGHSLGATNVAPEMAAAGYVAGPFVLLSPTFSRPDEPEALAVADRLGRLPGIGALTWTALMEAMPRVMGDARVMAGRRPAARGPP